MPTTKSGEEIITHPALWGKAKKKAAEQGKSKNWALISHIYQSMGGGYKKSKNVSKALNPFMFLGEAILKAKGGPTKYEEKWMGPDGKWRYRYYKKKNEDKVERPDHGDEPNTEWYKKHLPSVQEWANIKSGAPGAMQDYINRVMWSDEYVNKIAPKIGRKYLTWKENYKSQDGTDLLKDVGLRMGEIYDKGKFPAHLEAKQFPSYVGGIYRNLALEQKRKGGRVYNTAVSLDFQKDEDSGTLMDTIESTYESPEERLIREYVLDSSLKILDGVARKIKGADQAKAKKVWWLLKAEYKDPPEVAKQVGVSIQTVYNVKKQGEKLAWMEAKRIRFNPHEYFKAEGLIDEELQIISELIKAKRREIGETWTQPSGQKVKKLAQDKIVPVSDSGKPEKKENPAKDKNGKTESKSPQDETKEAMGDLMGGLKDTKEKIQKEGISKEEAEKSMADPTKTFLKKVIDILFDSIKGTAGEKVGQDIEEVGREQKQYEEQVKQKQEKDKLAKKKEKEYRQKEKEQKKK